MEVFDYMLAGSIGSNFKVCDPFVGSGSSAIAALKAGCSFVGADISEKACKISSDRIKEFVKSGKDILQKDPAVIENSNNKK